MNDNFDDINTYNGDSVHDMWVDFDNYENTGYPDVFDQYEFDNFIEN